MAALIAGGQFGKPDLDRLELVTELHKALNADLLEGGSRRTTLARINALRQFFAWADRSDAKLNLASVVAMYCAWTDTLVHRTRLKPPSGRQPRRKKGAQGTTYISEVSAYSSASSVGSILTRIVEAGINLIRKTRLATPVYSKRKRTIGVQAEKQNLTDTMKFGHVLQDICDGLSLKVVKEAALPFRFALRDGTTFSYARTPVRKPLPEHGDIGPWHPLINLRIEAELHMFVGQTGMNLEQAYNLELRHFSYQSYLDGYLVRQHKARRGGDVLFQIYKEYRPHFTRYLAWRRDLFPSSKRVFPFLCFDGRREDSQFQGKRIREISRLIGVSYVSPRTLRSTRVNWLLRKSADTELTAEMMQSTEKILLLVYEKRSLQRAMVEAVKFWNTVEPRIKRGLAAGPGECVGQPSERITTPDVAPRPDCQKPSGCLWCESHRDVDSQDYVWLLATFRYLKLIELSASRGGLGGNKEVPASHVIDRLSLKLLWLEQSNEKRRDWVNEARERVHEGNFHPEWRAIIFALEGLA